MLSFCLETIKSYWQRKCTNQWFYFLLLTARICSSASCVRCVVSCCGQGSEAGDGIDNLLIFIENLSDSSTFCLDGENDIKNNFLDGETMDWELKFLQILYEQISWNFLIKDLGARQNSIMTIHKLSWNVKAGKVPARILWKDLPMVFPPRAATLHCCCFMYNRTAISQSQSVGPMNLENEALSPVGLPDCN